MTKLFHALWYALFHDPGFPAVEVGRGVLTSAIPPVSRTGGYLIARRLGVGRTHESRTEWRQSVALGIPPDLR